MENESTSDYLQAIAIPQDFKTVDDSNSDMNVQNSSYKKPKEFFSNVLQRKYLFDFDFIDQYENNIIFDKFSEIYNNNAVKQMQSMMRDMQNELIELKASNEKINQQFSNFLENFGYIYEMGNYENESKLFVNFALSNEFFIEDDVINEKLNWFLQRRQADWYYKFFKSITEHTEFLVIKTIVSLLACIEFKDLEEFEVIYVVKQLKNKNDKIVSNALSTISYWDDPKLLDSLNFDIDTESQYIKNRFKKIKDLLKR